MRLRLYVLYIKKLYSSRVFHSVFFFSYQETFKLLVSMKKRLARIPYNNDTREINISIGLVLHIFIQGIYLHSRSCRGLIQPI